MWIDFRSAATHGGPGLHSAVERVWFGDKLPVLWWDQPSVAGESAPFRTLVAHAGRQLEILADSGGGQVNLIAHSFGGQIAVALARQYPGLIRSITLLGSPPTPVHAFLHFARRLLQTGQEQPGLRDVLAAAENNCDENRFLALIQACYPDGALPASYFGPKSAEAQERYFAMVAKTPPIDIATFFAVMQEFLHAPHLAQVTEYGGEVIMLMGRDDPVLCVEEDLIKWREVFPQLDFKLLDSGHFVHLELPPEAWCGKL